VLYVDHENSSFDVDRLQDMGYSPADLRNLRYLSFPQMPPLDGPVSGFDLVAVAEHHDAALVIVDTVSRAVAGEENSADTYRALYRHTLAPLKGAGRAVVRLDHRGHGGKTTVRGSSAKADDVDAVWMLGTQPGGENDEVFVNLGLERQRGNAHPDQLLLLRQYDVHLRHIMRPRTLPDAERHQIGACIDAMIQLRLPVETGNRKTREALRLAGQHLSQHHDRRRSASAEGQRNVSPICRGNVGQRGPRSAAKRCPAGVSHKRHPRAGDARPAAQSGRWEVNRAERRRSRVGKARVRPGRLEPGLSVSQAIACPDCNSRVAVIDSRPDTSAAQSSTTTPALGTPH
jgi:hypothetical protein